MQGAQQVAGGSLTQRDLSKKATLGLRDKPIVLDQEQMNQLSHYFGRNVFTADDVVAAARTMSTFSIEGCEITLDSNMLSRLKMRFQKRTQEEFARDLGKEIVHLLRGFAGI